MTNYQKLLKRHQEMVALWEAQRAEAEAQLRELLKARESVMLTCYGTSLPSWLHNENAVFVPVYRYDDGRYASGGWMCYCRAIDLLLTRFNSNKPKKPAKT